MAEERIQQRIKTLKKVKGISKPFAAVGIEELEKVLQILAEYKIISLKEWRELLKLLENHPEESKHVSFDWWFKEFKGKLEELEK